MTVLSFSFKDFSDLADLFNNLLGIIVSLLTLGAALWLVINTFRRKRLFISNVIVVGDDREMRKTEKKRFKFYKKPSLIVGNEEYSYSDFKKKIIRNNACVLVHSSSGMGKTSLLYHLAYDLSHKFIFRKIESDTDFGIRYISINSGTDFDTLLEELKKIKNHGKISVFIDGFDRLKELSVKDSDESISASDLLRKFFEKDTVKNFKKLIISFRTELFADDMQILDGVRYIDNSDKIAPSARIKRFSDKDVLEIFKNYSSNPDLCNLSAPLTGEEKKELEARLTSLLSKNKNTLFSIPFFIPFVPLIFSKHKTDGEILSLTKFDIIKDITDCFFEKEYNRTHNTVNNAEREAAVRNGRETMLAIVRFMNETELSYADRGISSKEIKQFLKNGETVSGFASKNILRYARTVGNKPVFEFLHPNFYEYYLACIITEDIKNYEPYERLSKYYNLITAAANASAPFKELFYQAAYSELEEYSADKSYDDFSCYLFRIRGVTLADCPLKLDRVLLMLPSAEKITYNGVAFDKAFIEPLAEFRELAVDTKDKDAAMYSEIISDGYVQSLRVTNQFFIDDVVFTELLNKTAVRALTVRTDSTETFRRLVSSEFDIDSLCLELSDYSPLYIDIFNCVKNNETYKEISLLKATKSGGAEEEKNIEFLKAVFYLDYINFQSRTDNISQSLLYIADALLDKIFNSKKYETIYEIKEELDGFAELVTDDIDIEIYVKSEDKARTFAEWQYKEDYFLFGYGVCLYELKEYEQAKPLLKAAYEWFEKHGIDNEYANNRRHSYGMCLYKLEEYEQALPLLKAAYEWYEKHEIDNEHANNRRYCYGLCLYRLEEYESALVHLSEVYNKRKMIDEIELVLLYADAYADCLEALNMNDEAEAVRKELNKILKDRFEVEEE